MKNNRNIKYLIIFISVFIVGAIIFLLFLREIFLTLDSSSLNIKLSKEGWTYNDVNVIVDYNDPSVDVSKYSFDGGKSWQKSNSYTVGENKTLKIMVMNKSGLRTNVVNYEVKNIDKEGPKIDIDENIKVNQGSNFNINDYLKVSDSISGIKGNISITPSNIDTNNLGITKVYIRVVDNAGNESLKEIYVEVVDDDSLVAANIDSKDRLEYRYREKKNTCTDSQKKETPTYTFTRDCSLYNGFVIGKYCLSDYVIYDNACPNGMLYNNECHDIKEEASVSCPSGNYNEASDSCIVTSSECSDTYSEWSEWTTDKIEKTDNIEVETRKVS